jgi:hypothetical protein
LAKDARARRATLRSSSWGADIEAPRFHHAFWRHGGGLAARGARAAGGTFVVAYLGSGPSAPYASLISAIRQKLGETGYVEGRNVAFDYRWADGRYDRLPDLAADLARICHKNRRIGAPNQRKLFCENDFSMIHGAPDAHRV